MLRQIDPDAMVLILPEGRMKRATGLDSEGKPMTVRGGIADILETIGEGRMLLAYSGGLHHVQAPGRALSPPVQDRSACAWRSWTSAAYRAASLEAGGTQGFRRAVVGTSSGGATSTARSIRRPTRRCGRGSARRMRAALKGRAE